MKKALSLMLAGAILTLSLTACGNNPADSSAAASGDIAAAPSSESHIVPTSFEGIYVNDSGTHYVVIEGDFITIDDKGGSSISVKENSATESTVYEFSYDGKEETFFNDDGSFMCSIGADEGAHYPWSKVNEVPQLPAEEQAPLWFQGSGSDFEMQLTTDFVTEMKAASEKVLSVNFITADERYKIVLVISYFDNTYSGYIVNNESGESYTGDLVFAKEGFVNFRFSSEIYPMFSDITSYSVLFGGEEKIYKFENCTGGEFTEETESPDDENNTNHADTLPIVGNVYEQSNGATLEIVHSNSEDCITAVKFDDVLLDLTNAQCGTDGTANGKWYSGEFNGGIFAFNAIYSVSEDSFTEVWFSAGAGDGTETRMEFDDQRFMGAYTFKFTKSNTEHDTSFLGKEYTYRANFDDGSFKDHTITLSKVDADGNLVEIVYDGYTIELTNSTSEYIDDFVKFSGNCPGHFIEIVYTYEYAQSGQNPPDTVYFTTGWGEGRDENMPILIDATFTN